MISERIARRYVGALFGLAVEAGVADAVAAELHELQQLYHVHTKLRNTLSDPRLPQSKKRDVLFRLMAADRPALLERFIALLVEKRRIAVLQHAGTVFARMQDEAAGIRQAHVRSALPLTEEQECRLVDTLSRLLGLQIVLTTEVDPSVIGGVVVKVGDLLIDGSVRSRLDSILEELRRTETATIR